MGAHERPFPRVTSITMAVMSSVRASLDSHDLYASTHTAMAALCGSWCLSTCTGRRGNLVMWFIQA